THYQRYKHFLQAFATLGIPQGIKTDNRPAYISQKLHQFINIWGVKHTRGIPHSSTGQSIVEKAHKS
ncbi:POK6 protein, partial [Cisticola juncidis]|nr:POK6 protein [Cisticola juncidis]